MTKICITTSYTSEFADIGDYSAMTIRFYATCFGLDHYIDSDQKPMERPAPWRRVMLIPELFDRGYEFVFWIDADALICRFDVDIRDIITDNHDLFMSSHFDKLYSPPSIPNTGVMVVRNCEWTRRFFLSVWNERRFIDHRWWENAAVIKLMGYNSLLDEGDDTPNIEVLERIGWLTEEYNFIPSLSKMERPFIRHYAGFSADVRRKEMPKYALQACFDALEATRSFGQPERGS